VSAYAFLLVTDRYPQSASAEATDQRKDELLEFRARLPIAVATALLAIGLLSPAAAQSTTTVSADVRTDISAQIDDYVADRLATNGTPAAAVAVVRGGETVHLAGYGDVDESEAPVTADTPFLIGSVSKPFTGAAVYQLIDDGQLALGDPVGPYVEAATGQAAPAFDGVTVQHLIHHTSGLQQGLALPGSVPVRTGDDALERRIGDIVDQHVRTRDPGARYEYSNANYLLLASIVEQVSSEPFAEYIEGQVFEPLGMEASFATDADPSAAELVPGHESWFGTWRQSDQPYDPAGAAMGYMGSTARDMAAFLSAELEPGQGALPFTAVDVTEDEPTSTGWDIPLETGIARGWFTDEINGQPTVSHAGSLGDYTTHVIMVPGADGLGIAVLRNASAFIAAGHDGQYNLSLGLMELLLGLDVQPREPSPLMTIVVPLIAWGIGLAVVVLAVRFLMRRRSGPRHNVGHGKARRAHAIILPSLAFGALAVVLLVVAPMLMGVSWRSAQLFYPDMAWGVVFSGCVALVWAVGRLMFGLVDTRRAGGA